MLQFLGLQENRRFRIVDPSRVQSFLAPLDSHNLTRGPFVFALGLLFETLLQITGVFGNSTDPHGKPLVEDRQSMDMPYHAGVYIGRKGGVILLPYETNRLPSQRHVWGEVWVLQFSMKASCRLNYVYDTAIERRVERWEEEG